MGKVDVSINELEIDLKSEIKKVFPEIGEFTEKEISWNSPTGYTEEYQDGWTYSLSDNGESVTVHNNGKHKSLTHLLEKGHRSRNGSWVPAQPHIKKGYNVGKKEYLRMLKEMKIEPK